MTAASDTRRILFMLCSPVRYDLQLLNIRPPYSAVLRSSRCQTEPNVLPPRARPGYSTPTLRVAAPGRGTRQPRSPAHRAVSRRMGGPRASGAAKASAGPPIPACPAEPPDGPRPSHRAQPPRPTRLPSGRQAHVLPGASGPSLARSLLLCGCGFVLARSLPPGGGPPTGADGTHMAHHPRNARAPDLFPQVGGRFLLVGDTGFEPVTSSVSRKRATAAPIARGRGVRGLDCEVETGFEPV